MKYTDPSLWSNMDTPAWVALASQNNDEQDQNDGMLTVEWKVTVVEVKHVDEDDEEGERGEGQGGRVSILQSHSCEDESSDRGLMVMPIMVVILRMAIMVSH